MADTRFFTQAGPFTLQELADIAQAEISGHGSSRKRFIDVAPLSSARNEEVSFLDNKRYADAYSNSNAGACIVHPDFIERAPAGMSLLVTPTPYHAYARVAAAFHPMNTFTSGVHKIATVAPSAVLAEHVCIEAGAVIGERVEIGEGTFVGPNSVIMAGVHIGSACHISANVTLQCCDIGEHVILHPGVRIGQDGFGFALGAQGHLKVPQLGRVIIEDHVEIGANTTIDRGTGPDTVIGMGTKIDNLVQIGHNVEIGNGCVLVAQSGISGSTHIGNFVMQGGQSGVAGHLKIGDGAQIAAKSGVMRNIDPGDKVGGLPAQPMKTWLRGVAILERLTKKKG